jgi:hypothetical protein
VTPGDLAGAKPEARQQHHDRAVPLLAQAGSPARGEHPRELRVAQAARKRRQSPAHDHRDCGLEPLVAEPLHLQEAEERSQRRANRLQRAGRKPPWRARFVERRLDGLHDEPRPGKPRTISDEDVERVIVKTLEQTPAAATHWSTRSMAQATGMSQTAVSRIWRAFGLKSHLVESFKLSPDPQFIDKVRDIVGLHLNPPDAAVVLCVDEKSQIQALDRSAPILPLMPSTPQRRTHDYRRYGTTNLYARSILLPGT